MDKKRRTQTLFLCCWFTSISFSIKCDGQLFHFITTWWKCASCIHTYGQKMSTTFNLILVRTKQNARNKHYLTSGEERKYRQQPSTTRHSKWVNDIQNETMANVMQIKSDVENFRFRSESFNPKCCRVIHYIDGRMSEIWPVTRFSENYFQNK